jgi:hypothetical protein
MGTFDHVNCELPEPDGHEVQKVSFQTKSLWCCMDRFTITTAGRLIYHRCRYQEAPQIELKPGVWSPQYQRVPIEDLDMEYHGDMVIDGLAKDDKLLRYAVRFTHGTTEWLRPLEGLPEIHRIWLRERG